MPLVTVDICCCGAAADVSVAAHECKPKKGKKAKKLTHTPQQLCIAAIPYGQVRIECVPIYVYNLIVSAVNSLNPLTVLLVSFISISIMR